MNTHHDLINNWFLFSHETRPGGVLNSEPHCHHSYELFIVANGSTTMLLDDKFISVSKNDIVLIRPDILHKNNGGTRHNRYALHFTAKYLENYFSREVCASLLEVFKRDKLALTEAAFAQICELLRRIESGGEYTYIHIAEIIACLKDDANTVHKRPVYANLTVNKILEYIHSCYADICGLDDIADGLHITKTYMCHIFKKETSTTVSDYLNRVRVSNAREILGRGDANVTETAMLCGYSSPMYFCRVFKDITGMTPMEYKKYVSQ